MAGSLDRNRALSDDVLQRLEYRSIAPQQNRMLVAAGHQDDSSMHTEWQCYSTIQRLQRFISEILRVRCCIKVKGVSNIVA